MAFIQSTTATVTAVLTRKGRSLLASNSDKFEISQYRIADDEVNYQLMTLDGVENVDQDSQSILNLPIAEPSTSESNEMLFPIFVNQTFQQQSFINQSVGAEFMTFLISNGGSNVILESDNPNDKKFVSINSVNPLGRNYLSPYYNFQFNVSNDFYQINFENPPLNSIQSDNWDNLGNGSYNFIQSSKSGNNPYNGTPFGSPSIVISVKFNETPNYHEAILQPQNKSQILISDFLVVTQLDVNKNPRTDIAKITIPLQIQNVNF